MNWEQKKKQTAKTLYEIGAIKFGEFTLTSGQKSPYYIDLRIVPSFPRAFDQITDVYVEKIKQELNPIGKEVLVGVPTAAIPLASLIAHKMKLPMIYTRKKTKGHGTGKRVEGVVEAGQRPIIIDDLITTGGSNLEVVNALKEEGIQADQVVLLVDRMQGGVERLKEKGIEVRAFMTVMEIVNHLKEQGIIPPKQANTIEKYVRGEGK